MTFREIEPIPTSDKYYDLFDGGYLAPKVLLKDKESIEKVEAAIKLVKHYLDLAEEHGVIEEI